MLFIGTIVPFEVFSADLNNPEIQRLIAEKQQKIAALEKCSKKVKGFKIAGISTIGLTAIGVGGNIALASKREDVSNQLTSANQTLSAQQAKAREKEECDKNPAKEWKDGECKDKVTTPPATNGNNNPETPETTITNNNESVEAEVDIDENQQGEEIVQEVVTTTNTDEDAKKRLAEQKRLEELDSKMKSMSQKADKYEEQYSKYDEKRADCETSLRKIEKIVEDIKGENAYLLEYYPLIVDIDDRNRDALRLLRDIAIRQIGVSEKLTEANKAYVAEIKAHSESNITTMDNALSEIESNFKEIEQMFGELQKNVSEMCAANEKIKKDLHL